MVQGDDGAPSVLRSPSKTSRIRTIFQHFSLNQILRSRVSVFLFVTNKYFPWGLFEML